MKEIDSRKAARVWQRVQGEMGEKPVSRSGEGLQALAMDQLQLSAAYQMLSSGGSGATGTTLMRLAREARTQAACLKGLMVLILGQRPDLRPAPMNRTGGEAALRWCYGQEMRLLKAYEERRSDPDYGPVFERMIQRQREHCGAVMELIGGQGKK